MFRRILFLSAAALALLWVSAAPGRVHAQRHRGSSGTLRPGFNPTFPSRFTPGFGGFNRGFRSGFGTFGPRFGRFPFGFGTPFNPAFNSSFSAPGFGGFPFGFGGSFFAPGFNAFGPPGFFRGF
jgi:hypothetical protein